MGLSRWHRFGYWLETFELGRRLVLRYEMTVTHYVDGRPMQHYTNRINGHAVVKEELR